MPEVSITDVNEQVKVLQAQLDTLEKKYQEYVPVNIKRTILILGIAALTKKPILILLGAASYFLTKNKSSP